MSTFTDKKDAITAFLVNRAQLTRVTNHEEIQRVTGTLLFNGGRRSIPTPVSRDKVVEVIKAIDAESAASQSILLSVLIPHFWDAGITPRFYQTAIELGLLDADASTDERETFRSEMLAKVYLTYATQTPDDLSTLFPQPEYTDYEEEDEDSYEDLDEDAEV